MVLKIIGPLLLLGIVTHATENICIDSLKSISVYNEDVVVQELTQLRLGRTPIFGEQMSSPWKKIIIDSLLTEKYQELERRFGSDVARRLFRAMQTRVNAENDETPKELERASLEKRSPKIVSPSLVFEFNNNSTLWDSSLIFLSNGQQMAIGTDRGTVEIRDNTTGQLIYELSTDNAKPVPVNHHEHVYVLTESTDGQFLAASSGREVYLWDLKTQRFLFSSKNRRKGIFHLEFSPDLKSLLSVSRDKIIIFDIHTGKSQFLRSSQHPNDDFEYAFFSEQTKELIAVTHGGALKAWTVQKNSKPKTWQIGPPELIKVLRSPDKSTLALWAKNRNFVNIFEMNSNKFPPTALGEMSWNYQDNFREVFFSPDRNQLIFIGGSGQLSIIDIHTKRTIFQKEHKKFGGFGKSEISPDGRWLAIPKTAQNALSLVDLANGEVLELINQSTSPIQSIRFSPNSHFLAVVTAGENPRTMLWSLFSELKDDDPTN